MSTPNAHSVGYAQSEPSPRDVHERSDGNGRRDLEPVPALDTAATNSRPPLAPTGAGAGPESTLLLKLDEAAAELRCTRRSLERQIAAHRLHVVHIGRAVRVERAQLEAFVYFLRDEETRRCQSHENLGPATGPVVARGYQPGQRDQDYGQTA